MSKICALVVFTVLFFTIKSFGGNHLSFPGDTTKKALVHDTAKKATAADSSDDDDNVRSYAIGLIYGSDQSYHGIHSSSKIPYLEPNFTYTAPSGFYALTSLQYILIKKGGGLDALDLNPGWNIDLADNTTLNFNVSKYFFRANTPLTIRSDLSNTIETYIDQWVGETEGKLSIDYDFYKQTDSLKTPGDFIISPDIAHTFKIKLGKKSSLSLIPEGNIDFGTRNADTHYEVNTGEDVETIINSKTGRAVKEKNIPNNSSFGTLDYTLIFTIDYKVGNFEFEPAFNHTRLLYDPPGIPNTPLNYLTLALLYTIE